MSKLYAYLTYAGALPFVGCAVCLCAGLEVLPVLGNVERVMSVYVLVIATFMAGAHWGQHLQLQEGKWCHVLPLTSNIVAVTLWLAFLVLSFKLFMGVCIVVFAALLVIDRQLLSNDLIAHPYFQTRCIVTAIVILMLVVATIV